MTTLSLDQWLAKIYQADIRLKSSDEIANFKTALASDNDLHAQAQAKLAELDTLVAARGPGACFYSTKYRGYLQGALA